MSSKKVKSKTFIFFQLLVGLIAVVWFSYDFFHTVFNGVTYTLRFDSQLYYSENALAFFIAVAIKLAVFGFFIWLIVDCLKQLTNLNQ